MVVGLIVVLALCLATVIGCLIADERAKFDALERMNHENWRKHE